MRRSCTAVACNQSINMGATFCDHHWRMVPSALQQAIGGLNKRAREESPDIVQHRWMLVMLQAREAVAKAERRACPAIAPAYKAKAEEEQCKERIAA